MREEYAPWVCWTLVPVEGSKVLFCSNILNVHVLSSSKHRQEGFRDKLNVLVSVAVIKIS